MYISRLFIKNFRNFRELDIELGDGVTCFIGENNSGKTNLFQALRLVLDGNLSPLRRRLLPEDLSAGLTFKKPEHVLVSLEFSNFEGKPHEQAFLFNGVLTNGKARLSYRFRPKASIRETLEPLTADQLPSSLKLDDYAWEMTAGGDNVDLAAITWKDSFGTRFSTDNLQQGYLHVCMEALRDVEARLAINRTSPLQQIIDQLDIPEAEQGTLVMHLQTANTNINASPTIQDLGTDITTSFQQAAGKSYAMDVSIGLGEPSFTDISKGLRVLLSGYGMVNMDPGRNGLGLNNILFVSMLLNYFQRRVDQAKTAGQLLLVEKPEAHLHPQLQRVLLLTLRERKVQVFITTHSTHITSAVPLASQVVLTSNGGAITQTIKPTAIPDIETGILADLERYLDATRSSLLYARKVLLVEGPAEQFLIPPLAKKVLGIDLDDEGIAVIPIFGTHFSTYASLFGPGGIPKKCAIVADGDLVPSDANPTSPLDGEVDEYDEESEHDLHALEGDFVRVFQCTTTFERELTLNGTLLMFAAACHEIGAPSNATFLTQSAQAAQEGRPANLQLARAKVLNTAKRFGKARFAQLASKHVHLATELPSYIINALEWLIQNAPNG